MNVPFLNFSQIDSVIFFFFVGVFASWVKSDLKLPDSLSQGLAIVLLLSIGLKGGHNVAVNGATGILPAVALGLVSCAVVPVLYYYCFKRRIGPIDAAALGACYGSVSAVTFIAAQNLLLRDGLEFSGYMVAIMALMELPAILIALQFIALSKGKESVQGGIQRIISAKSVILLVGGFFIGVSMNEANWKAVSPLFVDAFKGLLALYLLDLGVVAQKQLRSVVTKPVFSLVAGILIPVCVGTLTLLVAKVFGFGKGDAVLIACLAGSASYIAAPASIRMAVPEASPSFYVSLPLAVTFPFNIVFGIPLYMFLY